MEKFVSTEVFFWAFGIISMIMGAGIKFIYDVSRNQGEIKNNYLSRFAAVEAKVDVVHQNLNKKVEDVESNMEKKFESLKESLEHIFERQQSNMTEVMNRIDDKLEKKCDQISSHLSKQDTKVNELRTELNTYQKDISNA